MSVEDENAEKRLVPMVILPPGVMNQVEVEVVMVEPCVALQGEAAKHTDNHVEDVFVKGSMVNPACYVVETDREGTIPLLKLRLIEEAIRTAREELGKSTSSAAPAEQVKEKLATRIMELLVPAELR